MFSASSPAIRRTMFTELAKLSNAGLPIERIGELLRRKWRGKKMHRVAEAIDAGITRGDTIAEALAPELTGMETAVVEAAEQSGRLAEGFQNLADWHGMRVRTVKATISAMAYPLTLLHAAALVPVIASSIIANESPALPILRNLTILWLILGGVLLLWKLLTKAAVTSAGADRLLSALPALGGMHRHGAQARWCMALHFQIVAGRVPSRALEVAGRAAGSARLAAASERAAAEAASGHPAMPVLQTEGVLGEDCAGALATAEESGTFDTETGYWAKLLMQSADESMAAAGRWVARAVYTGAAIYAAVQIFSLAQSYFNTLNSLSGGLLHR